MTEAMVKTMLNPKIALIPGSFDPPTIGHFDMAERAAAIFDEIWVVAFVNAAKSGRFSAEEKRALLEASFGHMKNVHTDVSDALLADYAKAHGIGTLVKGARGITDFDYELSLSCINRSLLPELDTVILPTKAEYMHISSTMVSEMLRYGKDFQELVPRGSVELLSEIMNKR